MSSSDAVAARFEPDGEMTIFQAAELREQMLEALEANDSLEIALSRVTELDTAGVQVMLVLQREAEVTGKTLRWSGHSHAVLHVLRLLGLERELGEAVSIVGA